MNLLKNAPTGRRDGAIMGIRPEHLDMGDHGWEMRVDTVELLGAERLVYGHIGDDALIVRIEEGQPCPKADEMVHVRPREGRVHWFDAATGKRI
jgi:sn-glycerol 3-phosphate transport system ATP-binding protein